MTEQEQRDDTLREKLYLVIFGTDTPAGRAFDIVLIVAILISVAVVVLNSVQEYRFQIGRELYLAEWFFTILFTVEYLTRLYCSPNASRYARSFYGVVDLLAILPTYIMFLFPAAGYLLVIRFLRVLRIFRILKLYRYLTEANILLRSLMMARRKIVIFVFTVLVLITVYGSLIFIIEGPIYGFTSIPKSIYWAVVTVTTVGYGDITPHTSFGQVIASLAMLTGYAIIAVPTGIISAELMTEMQRSKITRQCSNCGRGGHDSDASYCKHCGAEMPEIEPPPET